MRKLLYSLFLTGICVSFTVSQVNSQVMSSQSMPVTYGTTSTATGAACPINQMIPDDVSIAAKKHDFSTFIKLMNAAGLCQYLQGPSSYTFFAPSDKAFSKYTDDNVESLMRPENKSQLTCLLQNHIAKGALPMEEIRDMKSVTMVNGQNIPVNRTLFRNTYIDGAKISKPSAFNRYNVVHVLNDVISPEKVSGTTGGAAQLCGTCACPVQPGVPSGGAAQIMRPQSGIYAGPMSGTMLTPSELRRLRSGQAIKPVSGKPTGGAASVRGYW